MKCENFNEIPESSVKPDQKEIENKPEPCLEKNCSYCCNPVKVAMFFPEKRIPVDKNGKKIWKKREELLVPESNIDDVKLASYDCLKLDKSTGKCLDYKNRPDICKNTSCIDENSSESIDKQHKKMVNDKFLAIKPFKKKYE